MPVPSRQHDQILCQIQADRTVDDQIVGSAVAPVFISVILVISLALLVRPQHQRPDIPFLAVIKRLDPFNPVRQRRVDENTQNVLPPQMCIRDRASTSIS